MLSMHQSFSDFKFGTHSSLKQIWNGSPGDFPLVAILHPSALEIAREISRVQNPHPREISRPRRMYFLMHSSSRQCTDTICIVCTLKTS